MQQPISKKRGLATLIIIILTLVIIAVALLVWFKVVRKAKLIEKESYQAVFLTNGQVYFGHLKNAFGPYLVLTDIYYLQVKQAIQPEEKKEEQKQELSLVKLGDELHGPKDSMSINKDHVLFFENLKDESKVVQAIKSYKK